MCKEHTHLHTQKKGVRCAKNIIKNVKRQPIEWEKIFSNYRSDKDLLSENIKNSQGHLGGSVRWASNSWFRLRSWSQGQWDWAPCWGPCLVGGLLENLSLPLPLPQLARMCVLSLNKILKKVLTKKELSHNSTTKRPTTQFKNGPRSWIDISPKKTCKWLTST